MTVNEMKLGRLNHVGVATPSIEQSLELYRNMFGAEPHGEPFDLPAQGVRVCQDRPESSHLRRAPARQGGSPLTVLDTGGEIDRDPLPRSRGEVSRVLPRRPARFRMLGESKAEPAGCSRSS